MKVISIFLTMCMMLILLPYQAHAEELSGTCGDNLTWTLDTAAGVLTISGTGAMDDLSAWYCSWHSEESYIKTVHIMLGVASIGSYAFSNFTGLTNISIPSSVIHIDDGVFMDCVGLTSITIPSSVTSIGCDAFLGCDSLTSISLPSDLTSIGSEAFLGCTNLTSINIPSGVAKIDHDTFGGCTGLTSINIPSSVTSIGEAAFQECDSLTNVYYGGSQSKWDTIAIGSNNEDLINTTIHYYQSTASSTMPVYSDSADDVIASSQLETSELLENISFGTDEINGPRVTILGKTFYLFQLPGKVDLNFKEFGVQMKADTEKKTVQLLIGFIPIDDNAYIGSDGQSSSYWTESYAQVKSLYQDLVGEKASTRALYNGFRTLRKNLKNTNDSLFLNISGQIAGFVELSYETGNLQFSEGGMILTASASGSFKSPIVEFPLAYVTVGLNVEAAGRFLLAFSGVHNPLSIDSDTTLSPTMHVGLGLGFKRFNIEGGMEGTLEAELLAKTGTYADAAGDYDPLTVTVSGDVYLKGTIFLSSSEKELNLYKMQLWPETSSAMLDASSTVSLFSGENLDEFSPLSRDYLNQGRATLMSAEDSFSYSKSSLYPYCEPKLIKFSDGSALLMWVDDNGEKTDADRTSLFYSLYNPQTDQWSSYATLWDSAGYNGSPVVYADGDKVYVVWQRIDESLGDTADVDQMMQKVDLYYSVFDQGTFSEPICISNAARGLGETAYSVAEENGTVAVTWVENSENDPFMTTGTNIMYLRVFSGGEWQTEKTVVSTEDAISNTVVCIEGGICYVSYELSGEDANGNPVSSLYLQDETGTPALVKSTTDTTQAIIDGENLYYLEDGALYSCNVSAKAVTALGLTGLTNFGIVSNGTEKAIITLISDGFTCEMYASHFNTDTGTWGDWVQLTNFGKYIRGYSAALTDDGKITAAMNLVDVHELTDENSELYGMATLALSSDLHFSDFVINDSITYDNTKVVPGGELPISFEVTNNSSETVHSVTVTLYNDEKTLLSTQILQCSIAAGETADLEATYTLPEELTKHNVTVCVTPDYDDEVSDNNSAVMTVGYADVVISNLTLSATGVNAKIEGIVKNQGYAASGDIMVKIHDANASGPLLDTFSVGSLGSGESASFEYDLPEKYLFLSDENTMYAIDFEAVSNDTEEINLDNNSDRLVFAGALPVQVFGNEINSKIYVSVHLENYTEKEISSSILLAVYDDKDRMLGIQSEEIAMAAEENNSVNFIVDRAAYSGNITLKAFWVDKGSFTPMTIIWSKEYSAG